MVIVILILLYVYILKYYDIFIYMGKKNIYNYCIMFVDLK